MSVDEGQQKGKLRLDSETTYAQQHLRLLSSRTKTEAEAVLGGSRQKGFLRQARKTRDTEVTKAGRKLGFHHLRQPREALRLVNYKQRHEFHRVSLEELEDGPPPRSKQQDT